MPGAVRYARSGDVAIAYQVVGDGPLDLLFVPGFVSHMELLWEEPATRRCFERLASFSRLILHDKREQGLSDRLGRAPTLEEGMADMLAVMDAVGSERAAFFGVSEGGPLGLLAAASHPERCSALVVYGTYARMLEAPDYPSGAPERVLERFRREVLENWGEAAMLRLFAPSLVHDARFTAWWSRLLRYGTSPGGARSLLELHRATDVRHVLPAISAPTLVLHRTDDVLCPVAWGREVAAGIPGSEFRELAGEDHLWMAGDQDELLGPVEELLTGRRADRAPVRALRTVLFTDVVGSTERAAALGDRRWRDLLETEHDLATREVERFGGRVVKDLGDGAMATFEGPAQAIRAAAAIRSAVQGIGLEIRAGIHTGECELGADGDLSGLAVHIAARVSAAARGGEILVSGTVKDLVAGSGLAFADRGRHVLKGVPDDWPLWAVA